MGSQFGFSRRSWVRKGSKLSFSIFEPGFGPFLAEKVQSLGFLERFEYTGFEVWFSWTILSIDSMNRNKKKPGMEI